MKYRSKLYQNAFAVYKKKTMKTYATAYYSFSYVSTEIRLNVNKIHVFLHIIFNNTS